MISKNIYIVFDNGKCDFEIKKEIERLGVNFIVNPSQGVATALNTGLSQINNSYIRRIDSDDLWIDSVDTKRIQKLLDFVSMAESHER